VSIEENKTIARRVYEEVLNQGNLAAVDELFAPNTVDHNPLPGQLPGFEGAKQGFVVLRTGFPDIHFTIEDQVAEDDKVVTRWTMRGTHNGVFMGVPPTGRKVTIMGIATFRVVDGRIVDRWRAADDLGRMQQIGAVPTMGQAKK